MNLVLDASAAEAVLFSNSGAEIVEAALLEDEANAYIHLQNLLEIFYVAHRRGALADFLKRHPARQNVSEPDKPDLQGLDFLDPTIFDENAGNQVANQVRPRLEQAGVRVIEAMDTELWQDAARLKSRFRRVSLADCFGVALARRLNAEFLTSDRHELEALNAANIANFIFIR